MKTILRLFGLDLKKPLEFLFKVLVLLDNDKLTDQLERGLCLNMTVERRVEVAKLLRGAALALESNDCRVFAEIFVQILKGIRF